MVKLSLRMNLADILKNEELTMEKLNEIHQSSVHFFLKLWYNEKDLKLGTIKEFALKNENNLHFKTSIKHNRNLGPNDFVWFDIINSNYSNESDRVRFEYCYNRQEEVLIGLDQFYKCAKFCMSEKPPKRIQKRNDNESSNYRKP